MDNKNWVIFYKNGRFNAVRDGKFYLRLLDLPTDIISVSVKCKTKYEYYHNNEISHEKISEFEYVFTLATNTRNLPALKLETEKWMLPLVGNIPVKTTTYIDFTKIEKVVIHLELEVYRVYKRNCISIHKCDWERHG
eukprot:408818_1